MHEVHKNMIINDLKYALRYSMMSNQRENIESVTEATNTEEA